MNKYIIKNCKSLINNDICELYSQKGIHLSSYCYCKDKNCILKQIVELCRKVQELEYQKGGVKYKSPSKAKFGREILELIDIQEVE